MSVLASKRRRLFFLETFGELPGAVGEHLQKHREKTLAALCREIPYSKMEIAKALSLLIHFGAVGFTNTMGRFKYFVKEDHGHLVNYPVYLEYLERESGGAAHPVLSELLIKKEMRLAELPPEFVRQLTTWQASGIIAAVGQGGAVKKPKLAESADSPRMEIALEKVKQGVINQLLEEHLDRQFTPQTKMVFLVVKSLYPLSVPLKTIVQQLALLKIQDLAIVGQSTLEAATVEHLRYLTGYGVVSASFERYQVNYAECLNKLKLQSLQEYCEKYLEEHSATVVTHLLSRRYIEDKFVQKHLLLENAQCKQALFSLLSEGLVDTQMVPRTPECLPSKSFHFWHADMPTVLVALRARVYARINAAYLELKQCRDHQAVLPRGEYRHKTDALYTALTHLHTIYFVIRL